MKIGSEFDFEEFLDKALAQVLRDAKEEDVSADSIVWDIEDAYDPDTGVQMYPSEFVWRHVEFELANIGDAEFRDHLVDWIDRSLHFGEAIAEDSWEAIWLELQEGKDIHTPVNLALAYQPGYEGERMHIPDGWHRTALYVKAGRSTIPAIVGIPKSMV